MRDVAPGPTQQRPQDPTLTPAARDLARQAVQCSLDRQDGGGPAAGPPPAANAPRPAG